DAAGSDGDELLLGACRAGGERAAHREREAEADQFGRCHVCISFLFCTFPLEGRLLSFRTFRARSPVFQEPPARACARAVSIARPRRSTIMVQCSPSMMNAGAIRTWSPARPSAVPPDG